ncbi:hypothetical protein DFH08DRAFT_841420 [Mycena albidolilacea]|uniref:Uncharacterized protein n=1 Tax=Mycena albidolilacea TaxID=1033008 RepID=A0AAD7AM66_9AGAR|nr:hypothetical protein DFH08DRAFT_841420 [Mycena albidolilacea]
MLPESVSIVQPRNSVLLPPFLNRHPTVIRLTLSRHGTLAPLSMGPIILPNVKNYSFPSSFVSAFRADSVPITSICPAWHADDPIIELPLLQIGWVASPRIVVVLSTTDSLPPPEILADITTHLPHIRATHIEMRLPYPVIGHCHISSTFQARWIGLSTPGGDQAERGDTITTSIDNAMKNKGETRLIDRAYRYIREPSTVRHACASFPLPRALCLPLPRLLALRFHLPLPLPLSLHNPRMCSAFLPALPLVVIGKVRV